MISEANQHAIEDAGLSFILGARAPEEPYVVRQWRRQHPGQDIPHGQFFTQPRPTTGAPKARGRRDKVISCQYRADRGHRTLRGIDEQKSFRMSKHDLKARPIYHHKRESIDAPLTIVFAALAVTRFIEDRTGWSIRRFVRTVRCYRTVQIRAGQPVLTPRTRYHPI
jgi:hypothetical protein